MNYHILLTADDHEYRTKIIQIIYTSLEIKGGSRYRYLYLLFIFCNSVNFQRYIIIVNKSYYIFIYIINYKEFKKWKKFY